MEKLTLISGALFLTADVFAIIALALPFWIVTDVGGIINFFSLFLVNSFFTFILDV